VIFLEELKMVDHFYLRKFVIAQQDTKLYVRQLQWQDWYDQDVPDFISLQPENPFSRILKEIQDNYEKQESVVVHCSAGVGRTGVIIAIFNLILQIKSQKPISVFGTVRKMRE
jgi:protein tyrosine phosphatase